jgi:hypothetical protein
MVLTVNGALRPGAGVLSVQRILIAVLASATLSAGALNSASGQQTSAGPPPNAASIIANNLGQHPKMDSAGTVPTQLIFPVNQRVEHVEISDLLRPMRTDLYGWAWQTCIRATVAGRPHAYAVFIGNDRVVASRMALAPDQCDQGSYRPLPVVRPALPKPSQGKTTDSKPT